MSLNVLRAPLIEFWTLATPLIGLATGEVRPNVRAINYVVSRFYVVASALAPHLLQFALKTREKRAAITPPFFTDGTTTYDDRRNRQLRTASALFSPRFLVFALLLNSAYVPKKLLLATTKRTISTDLGILIGNTQCGNLRIFLPLRFYVKLILVILKPPKTAILTI